MSMVTTLLLLIILFISLYLITFRVYSISILLGAIAIFIIGSFILFQQNHLLIGAIFLIVYSGAILVFICISLLLSPAIRPEEKNENNIKSLYIKGFHIFFLFFISLFSIFFFSLYFTNYNPEAELIEYCKNRFHISNNNALSSFIDFYYTIDLDSNTHYIFTIDISNVAEYFYLGKTIDNQPVYLINPIIITIEITTFNSDKIISTNFKYDYLTIVMVGIYLLIILLCCLVLFSINHEKRVIKRQDSVDQILKRWI